MLFDLALVALLASLWSCVGVERREARLRAGVPAWGDLARITGVADQGLLVRLPGVSLAGDGRPQFDPARRRALPAHVTGTLVDHPVGHGLCLSTAVAVLGTAGSVVRGAALLGTAIAASLTYQLLTRLYALVVWAEGRGGR